MKKISRTKNVSCPDDAAFLRFFDQNTSLDEREFLLDHILACEKCRLRFDMISNLHNEFSKSFPLSEADMNERDWKALEETASRKIKELKGKRSSIPPRKLIFASTFLVLCAVAVMVFQPFSPHKQISRGGNPFGLVLLEPRGIIHEPPSILRWSEVTGADGYNIKIFDEDLETIFSTKSLDLISKTNYLIRKDLRVLLEYGKTYIWVVEAFDDFENVITSESTTFTIRKDK
ncbi:MAG: hypothetical protein ABIL68_15125 [bacterium]